jgi:hypothetical protein
LLRSIAVLLLLGAMACGGRAGARAGAPAGDVASPGPLIPVDASDVDDRGTVEDASASANNADAAGDNSSDLAPIDDPSAVAVLAGPVGSLGTSQIALQGATLFYTSVQGREIGSTTQLFVVATSGGTPSLLPADASAFFSFDAPLAIAEANETTTETLTGMGPPWNEQGLSWNVGAPVVDAGTFHAPPFATADATNVYWVDASGALRQARRDGTGPEIVLTTSLPTPGGMGTDSTYVYWTEPSSFLVRRCVIGQPAQLPQTIASGQMTAGAVVADDGGVYWTRVGSQAHSDGAILRWRATDSAPEVLVTGLWGPGLVLLDGASIYWSSADLLVRRAPR